MDALYERNSTRANRTRASGGGGKRMDGGVAVVFLGVVDTCEGQVV